MSQSPRNSALAGVLPVFQTPYHDDFSVDFDTLGREIDWLVSRGADGVTMGMVSETLRLTESERHAVAEFACARAGASGAASVISVGAESSAAAAAHATHAAGCGATAVMAIPPISVAVGEGELLAYYEAIFQAAAPLPVVVQDASGYVGRPMSMDFQASLLERHGPVRTLFKPEAAPLGQRLGALRDATAGRAAIFEGSGGLTLVDSYRRGIVGTMPGADLIDAVVALWRALQAGDERAIYRIALPLSALVTLQGNLDSFLALEKHLLVRQGVFRNELVRGPRAYLLDDETRREADRLFDLLMKAVREP